MAAPIRIKVTPSAASAVNLAASQTPGTSALTLTALAAGPIDLAGLKGLGLGRIISITSGGVDTGIHWIVVGKDQNGNAQTENVTGGSGAAVSTVGYYTSLTSITPSGAVASTASAGTINTTASAALQMVELDFYQRTGAIVSVDVTGTISYTVQMTFDDCMLNSTNLTNNVLFATPASPTALTAQSASKYTQLPAGVCGLSLTIPTYTTSGTVTLNILQPSNSRV